MKRSLLILVILLIGTGAVLSAATVYIAVNFGRAQEGKYGLFIVATPLSEKPRTFLTLNEPDTYIQQAIANPRKDVYVGAWENTQIDDLVSANNMNNVAIQSQYYRFDLLSGDPPSFISTGLITWTTSGWTMWICLTIVSLVVVRAWRKRSDKAV